MNSSMEYYRVFYYAGSLGSITAASEVLCISQPAVSQAVKQLEKAAGCKLFLRTAKGVRLTTEGELLFSYVKQGIESILDGEHMLERVLNLDLGEIRIGASDMTLQFYLLPFLEQFHNQYPKIKIMVSNAPTPETLKSLYEGKIDFGVISTPVKLRPGVTMTEVKSIHDIFISGSRFSRLKGIRLDYECLKTVPCILLEQNTSTRQFTDQYLASHNLLLEPEFELATSDMVVQFALRNLGIGCVMEGFAQEKLKSGELFRLEFKEQMPKRFIGLVSDDKYPVSPAARMLLAILRGEIE